MLRLVARRLPSTTCKSVRACHDSGANASGAKLAVMRSLWLSEKMGRGSVAPSVRTPIAKTPKIIVVGVAA
jgi:hypothetical protein